MSRGARPKRRYSLSMSEERGPPHTPIDKPLPLTMRDRRRFERLDPSRISDAGKALRLMFSASLWPDWRKTAASFLGVTVDHIRRIEVGHHPLTIRHIAMLRAHERRRVNTVMEQGQRLAERTLQAAGEVRQGIGLLDAIEGRMRRERSSAA